MRTPSGMPRELLICLSNTDLINVLYGYQIAISARLVPERAEAMIDICWPVFCATIVLSRMDFGKINDKFHFTPLLKPAYIHRRSAGLTSPRVRASPCLLCIV